MECTRPVAQAAEAQTAERGTVLPALPSGPTSVLGGASRQSSGAKSTETPSPAGLTFSGHVFTGLSGCFLQNNLRISQPRGVDRQVGGRAPPRGHRGGGHCAHAGCVAGHDVGCRTLHHQAAHRVGPRVGPISLGIAPRACMILSKLLLLLLLLLHVG